ncbi:MAG TPA: DUF998 domain-containing protein [Rhodanobacteraceae bacterium]|nr:DUF998 domain-containing protein [Rhodanobacteraceae bacterium]
MALRARCSFGIVAAAVLWCGLVFLPWMVPGYDWVRQTVSEIGEIGSPARIPFAILLCCFAACVLVFAWALRDVSLKLGRRAAAAYVCGFMAVSSVGVGIFAFPHPLHNVFGMSELISYQAPWVLALTWRRAPQAKAIVSFSWIMAVLVWCAIIANLGVLDWRGTLQNLEQPVYGIVQRSLFLAWCVWLAGVSLMLVRSRGIAADRATTTVLSVD